MSRLVSSLIALLIALVSFVVVPLALGPGSSGHAGLPSATADAGRSYPVHTNIASTTFWVGELFNAQLADGSQVCSTYDSQWAYHWSGVNKGTVPASAAGCAGSIWGGCDGISSADGSCRTEPRTAANGFFPSQIAPKQNPFYLDLPYDDLNDPTAFQERCAVIPWANDPGYAGHCTDNSFSYMKDRWVQITGPNGATCYGQIQDAGPSHDDLYHDKAYVFGADNAQPVQGQFNNAGADVSPALNGCLGYQELDGDTDRISWKFVGAADVPAGPWTKVVTGTREVPPAAAPPSPFVDVTAQNPFLKEINWLAAAGISTGYPGPYGPSFAPENAVNRDGMAAFMYRLKHSPSYTPPSLAMFADVPVGSQFYTEISWLHATGTAQGYPDGYHPVEPVSREAMAAFLYRLAGQPALNVPTSPQFTDVPAGSPFFAEISWLASTGISTGYPDHTFRPSDPVSREAMAAFMYRFNALFSNL